MLKKMIILSSVLVISFSNNVAASTSKPSQQIINSKKLDLGGQKGLGLQKKPNIPEESVAPELKVIASTTEKRDSFKVGLDYKFD